MVTAINVSFFWWKSQLASVNFQTKRRTLFLRDNCNSHLAFWDEPLEKSIVPSHFILMNQLLWSWNYYTEKKNCALSTWQRNVYFTPRCAGNILMTSIKVKRVRDKIKQSCVWSRNFLLLKENNLPKKKKTFPITSDYHLCQDWSLGTSLAWNEDFAKNCVFF